MCGSSACPRAISSSRQHCLACLDRPRKLSPSPSMRIRSFSQPTQKPKLRAMTFAWPPHRACPGSRRWQRSEEHTSELQSLMRISYAVFCLKKKKQASQKNAIEEYMIIEREREKC